ncbi:endonuclease/exonuclease/phosphatase family protein [Hyunsoonleella sp. SJ7]|uniref:Endonuclease/exonuclease/phosphatase family protein n=1 Tax=Hyunsoonleella aquatilis TaxID=2762758 RepID=A0A923HCC3_9FLAO|nr:endonuclease/exonuclease/phosphatase family protein [Hyunsoonleella aquatilis]MBC3759979.1 endonuclease/exonuclease/phosphatase family protein [Hyunsoonleella aquatilis]
MNLLIGLFWLMKRGKYALLHLFALILFFLCFSSPLQLNFFGETEESGAISFMCFNANNFSSTEDFRNVSEAQKLIDFVKKENPDIVCFQEFSKFEFEGFSHYPYYFVGYRPNYEKTLQVIYSKYPIIDKGYIDFPDTRNQTIYADVDIDGTIVRIYNIHLQSYQLIFDETMGVSKFFGQIKDGQIKQKEQVKIVLEHASKFDGKVIFAGDFNSNPYSQNYRKLKGDKKDTFVNAGTGIGTTYRFANYPFRIDFVLVDPSIDVVSHQNFKVNLSDHEPILTHLKLD